MKEPFIIGRMTLRQLSFTFAAEAVPPHAWFGVSAVFHYLGPSCAVLLFPAVGVLGVAWLRIASAALIFASWTRPWRTLRRASTGDRWLLLGLGACLAAMNTAFYLALDRLPISLVAAIEFVGTIGIALYGLRTRRNVAALALAVLGVFVLIDIRWSSNPLGLFWAFLNGALFVGYIILGHKVAERGASGGVGLLGAAMAAAFVFIFPLGIEEAAAAILDPALVLAGIGVGVSSSVIPYICDQLAMSRLPRASFAVMLALLPATATTIGAIVLAQIPGTKDVLGVLLVMLGVGIHRPAAPATPTSTRMGSPEHGRGDGRAIASCTMATGKHGRPTMFEGTWRATEGGRSDLVVERVGDAWHLAWNGPEGVRQGGCAIAVGPWLYAARTPPDAASSRASGTAAEYDSRSGIIVYDVAIAGEWPATFYHPRDGGKLTTASSGRAPREGLEGRFLVGYQSRTGERHDAITMVIARQGDSYAFTWEKDGIALYEGVGLLMGPRFAAAWGLPGFDHQLVIGHLDGEGNAATLACGHVSMVDARVATEQYRKA